jgi:hypothetical protein
MKVIFKYESYPAKGHLNDKIFREGMNQNWMYSTKCSDKDLKWMKIQEHGHYFGSETYLNILEN